LVILGNTGKIYFVIMPKFVDDKTVSCSKLFKAMKEIYLTEKTFKKEDILTKPLLQGEYELCTFVDCDLSS